MKKGHLVIGLVCSACCALLSSCSQGSGKGTVWDDNKTSGNYNTSRSLWGDLAAEESLAPSSDDFIALSDEDLKIQFTDGAIPQSKSSPGDQGSGLPSIEGFHQPKGEEASVFKTLYFNTDDHILRDKEYVAAVEQIANYLNAHPNVYIFITGNADERGPEGYNLSLGARRANYVRTKLIEKGVDLNRIHTISYGKERPIDFEHNPTAWAKNRRTEFKVYRKA
jgi:peptidoglycan-associated lipoprotein